MYNPQMRPPTVATAAWDCSAKKARASSSVSDLRQRLQELQTEQEKVNQQLKDAQSN